MKTNTAISSFNLSISHKNTKINSILYIYFHMFRLLMLFFLFIPLANALDYDYTIIKKSKYETIEQIYDVTRNYFIELESIFDPFLLELDEEHWDNAIVKIKDMGYIECDTLNFTTTSSHKLSEVKVLKNIYINNVYFFIILKDDIIKCNKIVIFTGMDRKKTNDNFRALQLMAYPGKRGLCVSLIYQLRTIEYQCFAINFNNINIFRKMFFKDNYNHSLQLLYIMSKKGDYEASKRISEIESKYNVIAIDLIKGKLKKMRYVDKYQESPYISIGEAFTFMPNILVNYWNESNL